MVALGAAYGALPGSTSVTPDPSGAPDRIAVCLVGSPGVSTQSSRPPASTVEAMRAFPSCGRYWAVTLPAAIE